MAHRNIITGASEDEVWTIIADQLNSKNDNRDYSAQFAARNYSVTLDIDIHPDRGEDDEKPVTSFSALLPEDASFRFNIKRQGLKQQIGKLFGMQDVIIGHDDFDRKFLIQSNDEVKVKAVLSHPGVSDALLQQPVNDFKVRERRIGANIEIVLYLELEGVITDPTALKNIYQPFKMVLNNLD